MKIILTQDELGHALKDYASVPAGYQVAKVTLQRHSDDFAIIECSPIAAEPAAAVDLLGPAP